MDTLFNCPHCGGKFELPVPQDLEPLFSTKQAIALLNLTMQQLRGFLKNHPEVPARYMQDKNRRRHRFLYGSELRYIRNHFVKMRHNGRLTPLILINYDESEYPTIEWEKVAGHGITTPVRELGSSEECSETQSEYTSDQQRRMEQVNVGFRGLGPGKGWETSGSVP